MIARNVIFISEIFICCEICNKPKRYLSQESSHYGSKLISYYWCEVCNVETNIIEWFRQERIKDAEQHNIMKKVHSSKCMEFEEYESYKMQEETYKSFVRYGGDDFDYTSGKPAGKCDFCKKNILMIYDDYDDLACPSCKLIFKK